MDEDRRSGVAYGVAAFAAFLMFIGGGFQFLAGLTAVLGSGFKETTQGWLFELDTTTWGWIHLVLGILMIAGGAALFRGAIWARLLGVILAAATAFATFAWLPHYPVWGLLIVGLAIGVIWALTVHGRELAQGERQY
jgi:hypothetical protein